jgi:hypothetical protein
VEIIESTSVVFLFLEAVNGKDIAMLRIKKKWRRGHRAGVASGNLSPECPSLSLNFASGASKDSVAWISREAKRLKSGTSFANKQVVIKRKDMETGAARLRRFNNITVLSEFILLGIFNPVADNVLQ